MRVRHSSFVQTLIPLSFDPKSTCFQLKRLATFVMKCWVTIRVQWLYSCVLVRNLIDSRIEKSISITKLRSRSPSMLIYCTNHLKLQSEFPIHEFDFPPATPLIWTNSRVLHVTSPDSHSAFHRSSSVASAISLMSGSPPPQSNTHKIVYWLKINLIHFICLLPPSPQPTNKDKKKFDLSDYCESSLLCLRSELRGQLVDLIKQFFLSCCERGDLIWKIFLTTLLFFKIDFLCTKVFHVKIRDFRTHPLLFRGCSFKCFLWIGHHFFSNRIQSIEESLFILLFSLLEPAPLFSFDATAIIARSCVTIEFEFERLFSLDHLFSVSLFLISDTRLKVSFLSFLSLVSPFYW